MHPIRPLTVCTFGLGLATAALCAKPAHAEPGGTARTEDERNHARDLMREGNELYGNGNLQDAYAKYLEAWKTAQAFDIACNLGGTASELSMNRDAAEYLDYCLRHYAASSRPEAVASEKRARAAFDVVRSKVAAVTVKVTPPGAEVVVDGASAGRSPLEGPVFLEAGPHRIEARQAGFETAFVELNAKRGEATETTLELKAASGAPATGPAAAAEPEQPGQDQPKGSKNYVPAVVAASVGGVALAGGVVFLVMRSGKQSDASDQLDELEKMSGKSPCGKETTHTTECAEIEGLSNDAATFGTLSIVSFGVAAGAGVATFLLWPSGSSATGWSSTRPTVAASRDGFYASVAGRF